MGCYEGRAGRRQHRLCHPERRKSSAERMIFAVEGPAVGGRHWCAHTTSRSRSTLSLRSVAQGGLLHAPDDSQSESSCLVGMTGVESRTMPFAITDRPAGVDARGYTGCGGADVHVRPSSVISLAGGLPKRRLVFCGLPLCLLSIGARLLLGIGNLNISPQQHGPGAAMRVMAIQAFTLCLRPVLLHGGALVAIEADLLLGQDQGHVGAAGLWCSYVAHVAGELALGVDGGPRKHVGMTRSAVRVFTRHRRMVGRERL